MVEIFNDIRKLYNFCAPCAELADYIEFFSESSVEETARHAVHEPFTIKMFPSWTPTFWINLGTPYLLETGKRSLMIRQSDDVLVLRDTIVTRHNQPSDYIFTVKFFPGGLERILEISQTKFIDKIIPLKEIIPGIILDQVKAVETFEERKKLLEQYFLLNYAKQKRKDHYLQLIKDCIDLYSDGNLQYNTTQLAEKMFITSKTINRYFNHIIGISPKRYFSILRARMALTAFIGDRKHFQPFLYGYYDMSHFYKEAIRFTGQSVGARL